MRLTGGCQCGMVRFAVEGELGKASVCHCRMCQKAFGAPYGALVSVPDRQLTWTRGAPTYFQSSNLAKRGFCQRCGTPLVYRAHEDRTELSIGAFDEPNAIPPNEALAVESKVAWVDAVTDLPDHGLGAPDGTMQSFQHPDHDTDRWPR